MEQRPDTVDKVIKATCVLHDMLRTEGDAVPRSGADSEHYDDDAVADDLTRLRPLKRVGCRASRGHGVCRQILQTYCENRASGFHMQLECGPMPNLMVALPNIGGALCSEILPFNKFSSDCRYMSLLRTHSPPNFCDDAQMALFGDFLRPVFSVSRVQHISDLHRKFALRPHHLWKYGRHQSATAEIRRGKKRRRR